MEKEKNILPEEPLDLYAEFARLCGAPADMDRDGQIALFEEYQTDFDKLKTKLNKCTSDEEQKKLTDDFTKGWIANAKSRLANMQEKNKPQAPPEAYATFVRIYMDWIEKGEDEQVALVEESVRAAKKVFDNAVYGGKDVPYSFFWKKGSILFGAEFDEYVNEVWATFLEKCSDVDQFAEYLQKDFNRNFSDKNYLKKCQIQFNKMREKFLKRVFNKWDDDIKDMEDEKIDKYLEEEKNKRIAEFAKMKKEFEDTTAICYPSLRLLLRRPAQNMMGRLREQSLNPRSIPIGFKTEETGIYEIEDIAADGRSIEGGLAVQDIIDRTISSLDEQDKQIITMRMSGYKNTEIAKELGIAKSTVSNHIKKIISMVRAQL